MIANKADWRHHHVAGARARELANHLVDVRLQPGLARVAAAALVGERPLRVSDAFRHQIQKMPLEAAQRAYRHRGALWLFDDNSLPREAEALRADGELVLGTAAIANRLEDDREFALETAKSLGFDVPLYEEFTDYDKGIAYLEQHGEQAFAYKPDKGDPTMTYVPLVKDDPGTANQELQQYLQSLERGGAPKFVLQEMVQGVEVNTELWVKDGQPLLGLVDLEAKRRLVGDLGEHVGCAGDYLFALPVDHPLIAETAGRYLQWPTLQHYTGSVDANVIFGDGKTYFLENCFRFGYNAYATILQDLAVLPVEDLFRMWVAGEDCADTMAGGFAASLSLTMSDPKMGTPILIPPELQDHTYLYRGYGDDTGLHMVDRWDEVLCVTAYGETPDAAGSECQARAEAVNFPNKGYRLDLTASAIPTLPLARLESLIEMGWLEGAEVSA